MFRVIRQQQKHCRSTLPQGSAYESNICLEQWYVFIYFRICFILKFVDFIVLSYILFYLLFFERFYTFI